MMYEIDLLNHEQVNYINNYFKYLIFEDGRISNSNVLKICQTVYDGPGVLELNNYCHDILENANLPISISRISQVYFVKYGIGGQYKDHYDANPCGGVRPDYSMTCFLNDDYGGGELVIENSTSVKLSRGRAILYPGNLLHRVNEVTYGRRDVFVCWIES
jgi:PKHD-type hydroxylase